MAFTAKILSWRFRHLNIVRCLLKRRPTKRGSPVPQEPPPPSYAPGLIAREQALHLGDIVNGSFFWADLFNLGKLTKYEEIHSFYFRP